MCIRDSYKCTRPQGKRRFENAAQARKMLSGIGKRKGLARKNAAVVIGTTGILLAAGVFLAGSEQQAAFESALAEVTKGYYEIEENESSSLSKKFAAEADKKSTDTVSYTHLDVYKRQGPYILYTIVRIKSILNRYVEAGGNLEAGEILPASNGSEKNLMLQLSGFGSMIESAFEEKAPHKICAYIYEVSNAFNSFYHETKILSEENQAQKESYIRLLQLTKRVLETSIDLLGFEAPDKM